MEVGLELDGRLIRQCRVEPLAIIDLLDEAADHLSSLIGVTVAAPIYLLLLERFHKALRLGIVIGIADPAHARQDVVGGEQRRVFAAGVLHAAIAKLACRCVSSAQPTTRRLNASSTMARNANSSCRRI